MPQPKKKLLETVDWMQKMMAAAEKTKKETSPSLPKEVKK